MHDTLYFCWQCFSCKTWRERSTRWLVSMHIMEAAPQSGPVWAHSGALMMLPPLANCCVLAARWNVNGSTCDYQLHRGATQLITPPPSPCLSGTQHQHLYVCVCVEGTAVEPRQSISISFRFQSFPVCVYAVSQVSRAETIYPIIQVTRLLKSFDTNCLCRSFV